MSQGRHEVPLRRQWHVEEMCGDTSVGPRRSRRWAHGYPASAKHYTITEKRFAHRGAVTHLAHAREFPVPQGQIPPGAVVAHTMHAAKVRRGLPRARGGPGRRVVARRDVLRDPGVIPLLARDDSVRRRGAAGGWRGALRPAGERSVTANNAATEFHYKPALPPPGFSLPRVTLPSAIAPACWAQCPCADSLTAVGD